MRNKKNYTPIIYLLLYKKKWKKYGIGIKP